MKKYIALILIIAEFVLSAGIGTAVLIHHTTNKNTAGNNTEQVAPGWTEEDVVKPVVVPPEEVKNEDGAVEGFIENGRSDYKIVVPESTDGSSRYAASEIQAYLKQSTGCTLDIVSENSAEGFPFVSVGETKQFKEKNFDVSKEKLGFEGTFIKTVGRDIYIAASGNSGLVFAAYDFLTFTVGYEAYAYDEIYIEKKDAIPLYNFDYAHKPSAIIASSVGTNRTIKNAMKMRMFDGNWGGKSFDGSVFASGYFAHTVLSLLPPSDNPAHTGDINTEDGWYSNGQICLTKDSIVEAMAKKVAAILKESASPFIMIGCMDKNTSCDCNRCKAEGANYGGVSGVYMRFLNRVADYIVEHELMPADAEFWLVGMGYLQYIGAPVNKNADGTYSAVDPSIEPHDHVAWMEIEMGNCYGHSMYDVNEMCQTTATYREYYLGFSSLFDGHMMGYTYGTNFHNYMVPFNDFGVIPEKIKFMSECGCYYIYDQTSSNELTGLQAYKTYLKSKIGWDASLTDSVDSLTTAFFSNYYKAAGDDMYGYYNALRNHYSYIAQVKGTEDVSIYDSTRYTTKDVWSIQKINELQSYIDAAYKSIENALISEEVKTKVNRRIMAEELTLDYLRLVFYRELYTNDEYTEEWNAFIDRCWYCGTNDLAEGGKAEKI